MHEAELVLFWLAAGLLFYVYIGYPLFLALLAPFRPKRVPAPQTDEDLPRVTLLVAAHNEAAGIEAKLRQSLTLDYPAEKLEVLVASDGSNDGTDEIVERVAREAGAGRVRLLRLAERRGKTHAQNEGVRAARGEIIVFSDATNEYQRRAVRHLVAHYQDPRVGAVSGRYFYFDPTSESPTATGVSAFWNYENWIKSSQARLATLTGCCGCIYSTRREAYVPLADEDCSDLVEPLRIVERGGRVAYEPRAVTREETTDSHAGEFRMRVRVTVGGLRGVLAVPALLNPLRHPWIATQLISHKLLRWGVGFWLLLLLAASLALAPGSRFFALALGAQIAFYAAAGLGALLRPRGVFKVLMAPTYFCLLAAAAVVSIGKAFGGGAGSQTWTPVRRRA